jgi:ABC-type transporter Mla subunit MlaD
VTSPTSPGSGPVGDARIRRGVVLAVVVALLVLLVAWWWSFAGPGRDRFRSGEPTPADATAPPG